MSHVNWSALTAGDKWTFNIVTHSSSKVQEQSQHTETTEDFQLNNQEKPDNDLTLAIKVSERSGRSLNTVSWSWCKQSVYDQQNRRPERLPLAGTDVQSPADVCLTAEKPNIDTSGGSAELLN